jgi:hypothetical protein
VFYLPLHELGLHGVHLDPSVVLRDGIIVMLHKFRCHVSILMLMYDAYAHMMSCQCIKCRPNIWGVTSLTGLHTHT